MVGVCIVLGGVLLIAFGAVLLSVHQDRKEQREQEELDDNYNADWHCSSTRNVELHHNRYEIGYSE